MYDLQNIIFSFYSDGCTIYNYFIFDHRIIVLHNINNMYKYKIR